MFGLEDQQKKKKPVDFVYELEKELQDPQMRKDIFNKIEGRLQKIKEALRSGDDPEEFNRFNLLLLGYDSTFKVVSRIKIKSN